MKKQPGRNALLKIKKEQKKLEQVKRDLLGREFLVSHTKLELSEKNQELLKKEQQINQMKKAVEEELRSYNPVHPFLDSSLHITTNLSFNDSQFLRYRITSPDVEWDDRTRDGFIRITADTSNGRDDKTVGYSMSAPVLFDGKYDDKLVEDIGKDIARKILATVKKNYWR